VCVSRATYVTAPAPLTPNVQGDYVWHQVDQSDRKAKQARGFVYSL